jgi:hypothetical protein
VVLQNVYGVTKLRTNIEFFSMDSYLCDDLEELFRTYKIVGSDPLVSLVGIVRIDDLAGAGRIEDTLKSARMGEDPSEGLEGACAGGHKKLALLLIDKYKCDPNWGLWGACFSGHKELVLTMIERGARDFDYGLMEACFMGHTEIIKLMIEKGATECGCCNKPLDEH